MARQWRQGAIDGGGYTTTVAIDPSGSGTLLCGGDVSGVHRSINYGRRWSDRNANRSTVNSLKVACLKWHPATAGLVYACVGLSGTGTWSGMYVSSDYGINWSLLSATPKFAANRNAAAGLPNPWPRSTGNLLEFVSTTMYTGTFKDGLMRSTDGGTTWTTIALGTGPYYIRSITQDPTVAHRLFVATYQSGTGGVYRIDNANGTPTVTQLTQSPAACEELTVVNSMLYAAAGNGVYSKTADANDSAWTTRLSNGSAWTEIVGYHEGGTTTLYAGAYKGQLGSNGRYDAVMRSTDGGVTWDDILQDATISFTSYERSSQWWLATVNPLSMLGGKRFTCTQIAIDPNNHSRVFISGKQGIWATDDGGVSWKPAVRELGATINQMVAAEGNHALVSDADWNFIRSSDLFRTPTGITGQEVTTDGYSIASDGTNWYLGSGNKATTNQGGSLYIYSNFTTLSRDSRWDLAGATSSAQDTFNRTVSGGWGTSDLGGAWTAVSGAANRLSVNTNRGIIDTTQDNTLHQQQLNGVSATDMYAETTVSFDRTPTVGWTEARLVTRADATAANFYAAVLRAETDGSVTLYIRKFNGTTYIIAQVTAVEAYTPGSSIRLTLLVQGNTLTASAQQLSDTPEEVATTSYTDDGVTRGAVIASGSPGLAASRQSGTSGAIISFGLSEWQLPSDSGIAGAWPVGLAAGTQSGNTILVAAAHGKGLWRKNVTTDSAWSQVSVTCGITTVSTNRLPITWSQVDPDTVWAFDLNTGVYRSTDYGQTWSLIWAATGNTDYYRGWLVADPTDGQVVWVVTDTGFYKITNARSGTLVASPMTPANSPGPIALAPDGTVYIVDVTDGTGAHPPAVWRSTDHGASWRDIADDTFRNGGIIPRDIAATADGTILVTANGNGVFIYDTVATKQFVI
jgi:hypothetical protein